MVDKPDTAALVANFETKDRRFRIAQGIFMGIVFIVLAFVVFFQQVTLVAVREQLRQQGILLQQQKDNTDELKKNTEEQLGKVSSQLDCIAQFFANRNRTTAIITDLEQCRIVNADGSVLQATPSTPNNSTVTPTPSGSSTSPAVNTPTPSNTQQPPNSSTGNPQAPGPVEILGIPVCVPFTGLCVR